MRGLKKRSKYFFMIPGITAFLLCCVFILTCINPLSPGLSNYVNTLSGTGNGPDNYSHGHVHPLTTMPNGFTMWAPVTKVSDSSNFYRYSDTTIQGFTATHIPHRWISTYSSFFFMPETGKLITDPESRAIEFDHGNEIAQAHYYSIELSNGLKTEISPKAFFITPSFLFS